ncbi:primosomal replication protein PriC [Caviibacterium pharyngocola]|uniref:Primosomal replication protein PriB/PriC n=1 Tax=Caviibacterium pharyngocola TaxID=28159 RepID=A0A2M8RXX5_9PAST|nr:primosomal replication protein [Caviibacterium pharyngocola]PJG83749.1 primosomal replication protein PriB/PriC [Caviibacterium pharyngocola]
MNKQDLIQRLEQKIQQIGTDYANSPNKIIYAKFSRTLFSEDFQPLSFYLNELMYTVKQLSDLPQDYPQYQFYADKLLGQYKALTDALSAPKAASRAIPKNSTLRRSERERIRDELNQLPPRERLAKYYEFLQTFNEKIDAQQDLASCAQSEQEKARLQHQIELTRQRRARCLEAIEVLEEYLAFKDEQEESDER